ncbi:MAG TPA: hypothetical protein VMB21_01180 [Candidatus Limnocylindria bacterium]|nr:hypothetical protein [Candidatus Limnocylindria bacterium]
MKRRWLGAGLGFLIGAAANVFLVRQSMAFLGSGDGHAPFGNLFFGPSELSLFLFPFVFAAAASGWMPAIMTALVGEIAHHLVTLPALLGITEVCHDARLRDPSGIDDLWWTYGIYFAARLAVLAVIGLEIHRCLKRDRRPRLRSTETERQS